MRYDEAKARCRMSDDGCPHYGDDEPQWPELAGGKKESRRSRRALLMRRLRQLATRDFLTRLPNRRAIVKHVRNEVRRRGRYDGPLALFFIDLDQFKQINDEHSHLAGDRTLREVARALLASLRKGVDRVGRYGGDEFLGIAPQTDAAGAAALAERIRAEIAAGVIRYDGRAIRPTVSIGFAVAEAGTVTDYTRLLRIAVAALRAAKGSGRDRCIIQTS